MINADAKKINSDARGHKTKGMNQNIAVLSVKRCCS